MWMTRTLVARYSGLLAIITACIAVVPSLAFAQKFEYRDVIKTLEVKTPPRSTSEAKQAEMKSAELKFSEPNSAETKPAETKTETKLAATNAQTKPAEVKYVQPKPQTKNELPTINRLHTRWHMYSVYHALNSAMPKRN